MGSGISAMLRLGAGLELEADVSLETLSIGQVGNSLAGAFELQTAGTFLCYVVAIRGAEVHVGASLMDSISEPEHLLRTADNETGWRLVFNFISSLEKYEVQSLERPILVGDPVYHDPATCWIIA
ncbi:MAG: hypothetical protein WBL40_17015 [Terrimicrobiaceae bacterium]